MIVASRFGTRVARRHGSGAGNARPAAGFLVQEGLIGPFSWMLTGRRGRIFYGSAAPRRGYNASFGMSAPLYAVVAYVRSPIGSFVENLRRDLHPEHPELPAHVTILPPRTLAGSEEEARQHIEQVCHGAEPFEITMGDVETFAPTTPTVFIRVAHAAYRMRELHDKLNANGLEYQEPWPYMPHLTIVKLGEAAAAQEAAATSRIRWAGYQGSRRILVDELTFVREGQGAYSWVDLAPIPLGTGLAEKIK